jgi:hypothetical protein
VTEQAARQPARSGAALQNTLITATEIRKIKSVIVNTICHKICHSKICHKICSSVEKKLYLDTWGLPFVASDQEETLSRDSTNNLCKQVAVKCAVRFLFSAQLFRLHAEQNYWLLCSVILGTPQVNPQAQSPGCTGFMYPVCPPR